MSTIKQYSIKRGNKTVVKTSDPGMAAAYRKREGYKVIAVPVSR